MPLASQWYPPQHQGKALGIAGAGNSGTVFAALLAPVLAAGFGWNNVFGFAVIPLTLTLALFALLARNAPHRPTPKAMADYLKALGDRDSWWFMFFYSVTFGGFIGLASALPCPVISATSMASVRSLPATTRLPVSSPAA